jgi:MoxR-like ATPase
MAKMKGAAAKPGAPDPLAKAEASAKTESADQSAAQLKAAEADRKAAASDVIKKTPGDADASKYLARLSAATIIHDGAIAVDNALKQAKDSADALVLKEVDAEKKILDLMRQAETARLEAAQEAGQAALKIKQAVDFTREMARKATYAQNAAGQAMAAQMAQAMGFPVTPQGVPSPFPPPTATEASIPVVALSMTAFHQDRRSFLSSCL